MCGRFALDTDTEQLKRRFTSTVSFSHAPHYNVTPGMFMPIIVRNSPNHAILARWGLIPSWSRDPKIAYRTINARAEGIDQKPVFRGPFRSKRCLVPATGFFEWKQAGSGKIPYFIRLKHEPVFAFAGLYDEWLDAENRAVTTFTIITTVPNALMEPIHARMPVILSEPEEAVWLSPDMHDAGTLLPLLDAFPAREMEAFPVSKLVNNPDHDSPDVLTPADGQTSLV